MEEIDEAFNWLVLILGTLAATLLESLHLYPLPYTPLSPKIETQFMKLLFVPLIVLVISWLSSHLIQNKEIRIVLKSFSWIYALILLVIDLLFFLGIILSSDIRRSPPVTGTFIIPSLVYLVAIRKRYKLIFPDSKFLNSNIRQVVFCVVITMITILQVAASAPLVWFKSSQCHCTGSEISRILTEFQTYLQESIHPRGEPEASPVRLVCVWDKIMAHTH